MHHLEKILKEVLEKAIRSVHPASVIPRMAGVSGSCLTIGKQTYNIERYKNIIVLGAGKASAAMGEALEAVPGNTITKGIIVTKYGHSRPLRYIDCIEAGHPLPDEMSIEAGKKILNAAKNCGTNDLVILLISGGASALMEVLPDSLTLNDLIHTNRLLMNNGAGIHELNTVRKQLSLLKGGGLAEALSPAVTAALIISDVPGDSLEVIASGLTVQKRSTPADALNVLAKFDREEKIPGGIYRYLRNKPENTSRGAFPAIDNFIISKNEDALKAASAEAEKLGYIIAVCNQELKGEAGDAASRIAADMKKYAETDGEPACFIYGGETTVTVTGKGKGGRNQELVLSLLLQLKDTSFPFAAVSMGTDGTDGPTDAAGGIITDEHRELANKNNIRLEQYLENNNSYEALDKIDALLKTGPTGTNVMDIVICLIGNP